MQLDELAAALSYREALEACRCSALQGKSRLDYFLRLERKVKKKKKNCCCCEGQVFLIINSLFSARLRAVLFYVERASRLFSFWVYRVIYLLSPARLRDFLFYLEHAYPGYLAFGVYLGIYLLPPARL